MAKRGLGWYICSLVGRLCIDYGASENAFLDQSICRLLSVFNLKIGVQFRFLSILHLIRYIKSLGLSEQLIGTRQWRFCFKAPSNHLNTHWIRNCFKTGTNGLMLSLQRGFRQEERGRSASVELPELWRMQLSPWQCVSARASNKPSRRLSFTITEKVATRMPTIKSQRTDGHTHCLLNVCLA